MRNGLLGTSKMVILSTLLVSAVPSLAEVSYTPAAGNQVPLITLSGQIRNTDLKNFVAFARMAKEDVSGPTRGFYQVRLESVGGDVQTALSIGRLLRVDKAFAVVSQNGNALAHACLS